jgi:hypothetical protein
MFSPWGDASYDSGRKGTPSYLFIPDFYLFKN